MRYARTRTLCKTGPFHARSVDVECSLKRGIPRILLSGLGRNQSATDRLRCALTGSGVTFPPLVVTINLAPADLPKKGGHLDLAMAASLLLALEEGKETSLLRSLPAQETIFLGELSLAGDVRRIDYLYVYLQTAASAGIRRIVLPAENFGSIPLPSNFIYYPVSSLTELLLPPRSSPVKISEPFESKPGNTKLDRLSLPSALKKALVVSAAGWHSILLAGPPGIGKSTAAREIYSLLSAPDEFEVLEILKVKEALGESFSKEIARPFRNPHHTITSRALAGGGSPVEPGEITRAHCGLLVLDELAEFERTALQTLREPMQEEKICVVRQGEAMEMPSRFLLAGTTNPCPCGHQGNPARSCKCGPMEIRAYRNRIVGPLLDRFEMEFYFSSYINPEDEAVTESTINTWLENAVTMRKERFQNTALRFNHDIPPLELDHYCPLIGREAKEAWEMVSSQARSRRKITGIRRLARTIADLSGAAEIRAVDIIEAKTYLSLESFWAGSL